MLFSSEAYSAALNALLAEHDLGYIELVPENPFAARLKDGMMSAFKADTRLRFDEDWWVTTFNKESRIVQLNFVVMGFNELEMRPMLAGEDWQPVRNPLVLRNIVSKLDKAGRYIARRHGKVVRLRTSKLALKDWGLADLPERTATNTASEASPSIHFMSELPHPEFNTPRDMIQSGRILFMYYENPRTIGEMTAGIEPFYKYPQVAVVVTEERQPVMIVRVEESAFGTSMLCSVEPNGKRSNFGSFSRTDRDTFIRKVAEVASKIV